MRVTTAAIVLRTGAGQERDTASNWWRVRSKNRYPSGSFLVHAARRLRGHLYRTAEVRGDDFSYDRQAKPRPVAKWLGGEQWLPNALE